MRVPLLYVAVSTTSVSSVFNSFFKHAAQSFISNSRLSERADRLSCSRLLCFEQTAVVMLNIAVTSISCWCIPGGFRNAYLRSTLPI